MFYHLQNLFWGVFVRGEFGLGGFCRGFFGLGGFVWGFLSGGGGLCPVTLQMISKFCTSPKERAFQLLEQLL